MMRRISKNHLLIVAFSAVFGITYSLAKCLDRENRVYIPVFPAVIAGILCAGISTCIYTILSSERTFDANQKSVSRKKLWLITTSILLVSYFLCFLVYFPGVGMNDGLNIMYWKTGTFNQFPAFYGMFIIALTRLGQYLGTLQISIVLYSISQVVAVSLLTSGLIVWFWEKPVHRWIKLLFLVYYAIEPLFAMYAIAMLKDTLFSLLLTVLMVLTYELLHHDVWFQSKWFWVSFASVLLGIIFLRNNGSYLVIPFLVVLFVVLKKFRKKIAMVSAVTVLGIIISTFPVKVVGAENLFQEKAGIPLQQIAAVVANNGDYSREQADFINQLMPLDEIKSRYNPSSVDSIKWNHELFDREYLNEHKKEFLITWVKMLPANFSIYVKAYLQQTFYFWAPLQKGRVQCFYSIETYADNSWLIDFAEENGIHDEPLIPEPFVHKLKGYYKMAGLFLREGVLFWLMMGSALLMVLKRGDRKELLPYLPGIFLWLTIMISTPVSSSIRYVFAYVYSLPFYIGFLLLKERKEEEVLENDVPEQHLPAQKTDIALIIAITSIIIGHIVPWGTAVRNLMFSFQMPLLFVLAGYRMKTINSVSDLLEEIKTDFRYLMVPYLVFHIMDSLLGIMLYGETANLSIWAQKLLWASGVEHQGHPSIGAIWMFNVLFWAKTLYSVIELTFPKRFNGIICGILAGAGYVLARQGLWLIFSLDIVLVVTLYLYLGRQVQKGMELFARHRFGVFIPLGIWLFLWSRGFYIEFAARHYPLFPLTVLESLCGALCVLLLSRKIEKYLEIPLISSICGINAGVVLGLHHLSGRCPWLWGHGVFYDCIYNLVFLGLMTAAIVFAKKWLNTSRKRWERAFLAVLGIYIIRQFFSTTMFVLVWLRHFDLYVRLAAVILVWARLSEQRWEWNIRTILLAGTGMVFTLSCLSNGYVFLFDIALFLAGIMDISYEKVLKNYCIYGAVILGLAILGALTGCIKDLIYSGMRHSFGVVYPTDFAAHVVYLFLALWVVFRKVPAKVMALVMGGLSFFLYHYCVARCGTIVMGISAIAVLVTEQIELREKDGKPFGRIMKGADWLTVCWMPLCAAAMITMSVKYSKEQPALEMINRWISSRLRLANNAMNQYGIRLFGTAFEMIGGGNDTVSRYGYNFVDSSYCMILLRYGTAVLLALCVLSMWATRKAIRAKNRRLAVAMAMIAVHSLIEHHLTELAYNPFLLLAFAELTHKGKVYEGIEAFRNKKTYGIWVVCVTAGILFRTAIPASLGYVRTMVTLLQLNKPRGHLIFIAGILSAVFLCIVTARKAAALFLLILRKEKPDRRILASAALCIAAAVGIAGLSETVLKKKSPEYDETLRQGKQIITKLTESEMPGRTKPRICVDDVPELYKRYAGGIEDPVLSGGSLASESDIVLFTNIENDFYHLTDNEFLFGEVSERQGVYVKGEEAAKSIEACGIRLEDHYSVRHRVDLKNMADANGLRLGERGGLLIDGTEQSLIHGPWVTIYKGKLQVNYRIKLLDCRTAEGEVAKIRLSAESGDYILLEKPVNREDFDENGICMAAIEQWMESREGVEFLLFAQEGTVLEIEEITYGKNGR